MLNEPLNAICVLIDCPQHAKFDAVMDALEQVQEKANRHFGWSHHGLNLEPFDTYGFWDVSLNLRPPETRPAEPSVAAMIRTQGDSWKSFAVTHFLLWVSRQLPDARIRANDGGGYIRRGGVVIANGRCAPDREDASAWEYYFVETEGWTGSAAIFRGPDPLRTDPLFVPTPAKDFARRAEVRALGLPRRELERRTIEQLTDRLRFPWDVDVV